jgi:hypothetical protein
VEEYLVRQRTESLALNNDEQRRLVEFSEKYSFLVIILKEIVPCQSAAQWDPDAIMNALQEICFGSIKSAANITRFMSAHQAPKWHCVRRVAFQGASYCGSIWSDGLCMTCHNGCVQMSPLEPDGRPGRYRMRFIPDASESRVGNVAFPKKG